MAVAHGGRLDLRPPPPADTTTNLALHAANAGLVPGAPCPDGRPLARGARWPHSSWCTRCAWNPWPGSRSAGSCSATFLALLTLLAYARAVRRGGVLRSAAVPLLFALALMTKPMAVTLPLLLLLLDWWPLGRWSPGPGRQLPPPRLWLEKLPLFLLAAASAAVTLVFTSAGGVVVSLEALPLGKRLANAVISAAAYLGKTLWPADLAVFYPHLPEFPPVATVA